MYMANLASTIARYGGYLAAGHKPQIILADWLPECYVDSSDDGWMNFRDGRLGCFSEIRLSRLAPRLKFDFGKVAPLCHLPPLWSTV